MSSLKIKEDYCGLCNKRRCEICKHITKTHQFESLCTIRIYSIRLKTLNSASENVVYLFIFKTCHKQYTLITEKIWRRFNNYRWYAHRNVLWNKKVKQESCHDHFAEDPHQRESNWEVKLIDQGVSVDDLRRRESY